MHVELTPRTRAFTILGNEVLRDRRLSFTARGILCYLLSLPDGAREDVRTLADKNPKLGRRSIAKAVDELVELGYYVRRTARDPDTGQVRTRTYVFDTPHDSTLPLPASPGTGPAAVGCTGTSPTNKNPEEEPSHPAPSAAEAKELTRSAPANDLLPRQKQADDTSRATPPPDVHARGFALLSRLARREPKLGLSAADTLALAPLAQAWLDTGVSEPETRSLLTQGLPPVVHSPRALLADRLARKMPEPRNSPEAHGTPALAECAECRDPLPRNQRTGVCAPCTGATPRRTRARLPVKAVAEHVAALRRAATCGRGTAVTAT